MAAGSALRCHDVRLRRRGRRRYNAARRRGRRRYDCDRMFGSLRSGDVSLREGRDSSRPRLYLRSVATSATLPLPTAIYISTLLHGHFYDGEATSLRVSLLARAPSPRLRPHARLTSFGGCVATMPHDGEATSLRVRPHVRLTSFGGYVATGGTRFIASAPVPPLGRNKCDPPANHHSLPTAIYISTLLHGHFCDGEAPSLQCRTTARAPSPLLRPHVRLTSFGGYVATGVGIAVAARPAAWHVATAPSPSRNGCGEAAIAHDASYGILCGKGG